ncbi:MAG TPA: phosphate/phosphite/phosphonate ABC transporter substrate-binding protein [Bauldia sp.]|nr:phosphate/phosphite/phosphonate ABC transporter substrate-binding protein [Bauldia sp.]
MRIGWRTRVAFALVFLFWAPLFAHADWRGDLKVLRIGYLAPSDAPDAAARLEPFRAYMQSQISLPVELVPATSTAILIDAIATARVSYAIMSGGAYVSAAASCTCVSPLAEPAAFDGSRGFHALLLARADSAIQSLSDTAGLRLALSADDSVAGRLLPMHALAAAGMDPATHFAQLDEAAGPQAAVQSLLDGRSDLSVAWSSLSGDAASGYSFGLLTDMVRSGALAMDQVRIVWQSPLIPFGPHVVRSDLPAEAKQSLLSALTGMAAASPDALDAVDDSIYGGGGFVPVTAGDYAPLAALVTPAAPTAADSSSPTISVPAPPSDAQPPAAAPTSTAPAPLTPAVPPSPGTSP